MMAWNSNNERGNEGMVWGAEVRQVNVFAGGSLVTRVDAGAAFGETVSRIARNLDYGTFNVYVTRNGQETEVQPHNAPDTFESIESVRIERYNKAG